MSSSPPRRVAPPPSRGDSGSGTLPLELELGLLGGPRLTGLPSHAGQQLPGFAGHSEQTVAPAATKRGGSLTYPAHATRGSGQPRRGGWAPGVGTSAQGWPRPSSAASQTPDAAQQSPQSPPPPQQPRQPASASASAKQQRWALPAGGAGGPARRPHSAAAAPAAASTTAASKAAAGAMRPSSAAVRRAAAAKEREPHRQFTQMLKQHMAPEGFVGSHLRAPDGRLPASFVASLHRNHGGAGSMVSTVTLRAWETSVLQDEGLRAKLGLADHGARAAPPHPREPPHPEGAAPFSKHEMRQFLRHAQRYFVSVDPKQPFAVPRTGWQPGASTTYARRGESLRDGRPG